MPELRSWKCEAQEKIIFPTEIRAERNKMQPAKGR